MALHLLPMISPCSLKYCFPRHLPQRALRCTRTSFELRCSAMSQQHATERPSANYQPTTWSSDFIKSLNSNTDEIIHKQRATKLKREVKAMIGDEDSNPLAILELIDDIQRLGVSHLFKKDIRKALDRIVTFDQKDLRLEESAHATALFFRLCREHGYNVSQDVFKSFKDQNGNFIKFLKEDIKGLLSLYEASFLGFEGEELLDEAKTFATTNLKRHMGSKTNTSEMEQILNHALELPLHHRMLRLEARWYIEAYSKRKHANHLLLQLAVLDFNMVQSTLQRELQHMSRWWEDMALANKLNFVRDWLVECFFWTVGMVFEPKFSDCRKGLTKVIALIATIDDIYDVYGLLDELELFTDAVERWDLKFIEILPDYMKLCFLALYNSINEMAYDTLRDQGVNIIPYLTKAWGDLCKAFLVEARWRFNKETPKFDAYLDTAWRSVSGAVILIHAYFLMTKNITKESLDSLQMSNPLLQCSSIIFRLCNDLDTSKAELERGKSANSILCYMQEKGVSEEVACKHISKLIEEAWKKINKNRADDSSFGKPFVETTMNLARVAQCTHLHGDGHGDLDTKVKNQVLSVIIEPIQM